MKTELLQQIGMVLAAMLFPIRRGFHWAYDLQMRERSRLYADMSQIRGLMPLLMKQRNGYRWTLEERRMLKQQLGKLMSLGPYLVLFVSPGGFFVPPVMAWWLDRRRKKRLDGGQQPAAMK